MIDGHSVLGLIPARGGSKGVPRKNVRDLAGRPLLEWTVRAGQASAHLDRVVLSSDDDEIIAAGRVCGAEVPFRRPARLARDETPGIDVVLHALDALPAHDYVALLQPTSPLRTAADIDACLRRCVDEDAPACVSVTEAAEPPHWVYTLDDEGRLCPVMDAPPPTRRQDAPACFALNGAVYVARCDWLREARTFVTGETAACVMDARRSADIDTELDFAWASFLMGQGGDA